MISSWLNFPSPLRSAAVKMSRIAEGRLVSCCMCSNASQSYKKLRSSSKVMVLPPSRSTHSNTISKDLRAFTSEMRFGRPRVVLSMRRSLGLELFMARMSSKRVTSPLPLRSISLNISSSTSILRVMATAEEVAEDAEVAGSEDAETDDDVSVYRMLLPLRLAPPPLPPPALLRLLGPPLPLPPLPLLARALPPPPPATTIPSGSCSTNENSKPCSSPSAFASASLASRTLDAAFFTSSLRFTNSTNSGNVMEPSLFKSITANTYLNADVELCLGWGRLTTG
mmetsp:Transcript_33056/g.65863  ORF Transcript_33056/g.65863 Transcript_33056/m.65863 type:complete len:282 (-) Transcript_33056:121-966(-)